MSRAAASNVSEFLREGRQTQADLRAFKAAHPLADYGWYPYDSLSALPVVADLLAAVHDEVAPLIRHKPVLDLGCADGDWAVLFSRLGAQAVDAVDHRESNFNQMRGAAELRRSFDAGIEICDADLDGAFTLPRPEYGLALFLGTLYHLKNPFYVLEKLAEHSDWCIVSTRIAQVTPRARIRIDAEPVAYLLASREANNDPTNFWIFSPAGLIRILERTGWMVMGQQRLGCQADSDPVNPEADERMFVLLKSRKRHPELHVRTLEGWHEIEQNQWRWTAKRFSIEVTLPETEPAAEFALRFRVPEAVLAQQQSVRVECRWGELLLGAIHCDKPEPIEFRGVIPASAGAGAVLRLEFTVDSAYVSGAGDVRDLGVIVPLLDGAQRHTQRLPFRIS
jgi:hypothetical protein